MLQKHERNGQVRIHLNYDTEAEVFIVTVCDDGVGISEEISEKIFTLGFFDEGNQSWVWIESHPFNRQTPRWIFRIFQTNKWRYNRLSRITKKEDQNDDKCPDNRR